MRAAVLAQLDWAREFLSKRIKSGIVWILLPRAPCIHEGDSDAHKVGVGDPKNRRVTRFSCVITSLMYPTMQTSKDFGFPSS